MHTEFSVVDGAVRIDDVVAAAAADLQPALAITDLSNLFGAVKFYKAARSAGVKPIIGAEVVLEDPARDKLSVREAASLPRLLLLVQNTQGYLNLCELLARAWTGNEGKGQPTVSAAWLQDCNEGLIVLSGAQAGPVGQALVQGDTARAHAWALQDRKSVV